MAGEDWDLRLENQDIYLTVPASFDVVARELTVEAAEMAGIHHVTLLEEPQAALYAWIDASGSKWRDLVRLNDVIMVVDVGGGTTDFSLIRVSEDRGELALERVAVGEHLLVGGDNMDLALAHAVARRMAVEGQKLNSYQIRGLCHACRLAKEHLLQEGAADVHPLAILGRGSSVIAGTIKTELHRSELEQILVDGFFPVCENTALPQEQRRVGMRELGLAYTSDPAITRHLAHFLCRPEDNAAGNGLTCPTAVLFNGGVMKAAGLRRRLLDTLSSWFDKGRAASIREIGSQDYELSVARGGAYYGLARRGKGIRIRGGLGRTYYIGVEMALPAVPGIPTPLEALCVAAFGMEEGTEEILQDKEFGLVVGEPVKFDFLGSHRRRHDTIGTVVEDWEEEIEKITTLETRIEGEGGAVVPVGLHIKVTEVGTLELWCVSREDGRRFKLEFNVRERDASSSG
jgi:hypothetical protein